MDEPWFLCREEFSGGSEHAAQQLATVFQVKPLQYKPWLEEGGVGSVSVCVSVCVRVCDEGIPSTGLFAVPVADLFLSSIKSLPTMAPSKAQPCSA